MWWSYSMFFKTMTVFFPSSPLPPSFTERQSSKKNFLWDKKRDFFKLFDKLLLFCDFLLDEKVAIEMKIMTNFIEMCKLFRYLWNWIPNSSNSCSIKKTYSIPSMSSGMARYFHTYPFPSTCHESFLQSFTAQGPNLWWGEASCSCRTFWQHSEFLVSAALAGRRWVLRAPLVAQQEAA